MRIEDVDAPRSDRDAERVILAALHAYGFESDAPIVRQSERTALYDLALERLRSAHAVYECACSRREVLAMPPSAIGEHVYARVCRGGIPQDRAARPQRSWRLDVDAAVISFRDRLQGLQRQDLATEVGDFVVRRADGLYAYQLAVVVDDAEQAVTHVVRGADLLVSTARQIYLQRRLQLRSPSYLHVPVAIDALGEKLSKQTLARPIPLDDPLPPLRAAWTFLQQEEPRGIATVRDFWSFAARTWSVRRLPPIPMLPAPVGM